MNEHIHQLQVRAMNRVWNGNDPDGDVDKMYIPAAFAEAFAKEIAMDCAGICEAIWNGNKIEGTMNNAKAIAKRYGVYNV